jgi:hypothetical protein
MRQRTLETASAPAQEVFITESLTIKALDELVDETGSYSVTLDAISETANGATNGSPTPT